MRLAPGTIGQPRGHPPPSAQGATIREMAQDTLEVAGVGIAALR
jgi:hypothetical protein